VASQIWIGTSGWVYPHWRRRFYPDRLPAREQLAYYGSHFSTVELNNSFYRQSTAEPFQRWSQQAPAGFLFAVKASRYITHLKRLAVEQSSVDMVIEAARGLGKKLGPILFQLPPNWECDLDRLGGFLLKLPAGLRFAFEFRHPSWLAPRVLESLRDRNVALCVPDHPTMPQCPDVTADFAYVRMHQGAEGIGYGLSALRTWSDRIRTWRAQGAEVYVYFNNDAGGHAIKDAESLRRLLGQRAGNPLPVATAYLETRP
jgi:uncharacterized protein YecE (DUF72 family)